MDTTTRDQRDQARWVILLGTLAGAVNRIDRIADLAPVQLLLEFG